MKYFIGFKFTRKAFFKWWPEGPEEAFDKNGWIITESNRYKNFSEYTIIDTSTEFSEKQAKTILSLMDIVNEGNPTTPIIKRKDETPNHWTLFKDGKMVLIEVA